MQGQHNNYKQINAPAFHFKESERLESRHIEADSCSDSRVKNEGPLTVPRVGGARI